MITSSDLYRIYQLYPSIQTDTRKIQPDDIYFALKGPNFNGNEFAAQALEKKAAFVVIDEPQAVNSERVILVRDVLEALHQLAKYHREQLNIPFLAITGSNGKTTTKELIYAVLSSTFKTYTTKGNLNNHIGIPLTMLQIKKDAEIAVIEMGANHQGEIAGYCQYVLPTHGIITNAGKAHLEGFGGIEGVRKGKGELFDFLRENGGSALVMWDYKYLREMSKGIEHIMTYGTEGADVTGKSLKSEPFLQIAMVGGFSAGDIDTQLVGDYNLPNVLAAVAAGKYFNVPEENIKRAIENYIPSNSRSQLVQKDSNRIILDAYNANPSSMKAAIENFSRLPDPNKILILGAMAELGADSLSEHENLVELVKRYSWTRVALVGGDFLKIPHPYLSFDNSIQAKEWLQQQHIHDSSLLIKGSRSMQMEKVIE